MMVLIEYWRVVFADTIDVVPPLSFPDCSLVAMKTG